jgi:hypothetical protein
MAKLQKHSKGAVPTMEEASNNLGDIPERIKPMSFKLPESFNKEFKQFALDHGISLTELLKRSFHHYKKSV